MGTTNYDVEDTAVYTFGKNGTRLNFIYWLPGKTIESLVADNFEISIDYFWDKEKYSYTEEAFRGKWITPTVWEEYKGGVIGTAVVSWLVKKKKYLADEMKYWGYHQGDIVFEARTDNEFSSLAARHEPVPEPMTILLFVTGLVGLAGFRLRRKK